MIDFSNLIKALYEESEDSKKTTVLKSFFYKADDQTKIWIIAFASGYKFKKIASLKQMKAWALEVEGLPEWLFEESNKFTVDLAETISHILPRPEKREEIPLSVVIKTLIELRGESEEKVKASLIELWEVQNEWERYITIKMATGRFKIPASEFVILDALSKASNIELDLLSLRVSRKWSPWKLNFHELIMKQGTDEDELRPFSFCKIAELEISPDHLGNQSAFTAEYLWDGIRVQIIHNNGRTEIWNQKMQLLSSHFPELLNDFKSNFILEGQIVAFSNKSPMSEIQLSKRLQTKPPGRKLMTDVPVVFFVGDILSINDIALDDAVFTERKRLLDNFIRKLNFKPYRVNTQIKFNTWDELIQIHADCRKNKSMGILVVPANVLRNKTAEEVKWWAWPAKPHVIKAILMYAHLSAGNRFGGFTDYSFGVWKGDELVVFAKASEGLDPIQFAEISQFIKENTIERFGPVRVVKPQLVFDLSFTKIFKSTRHKSGVGVTGCRIEKWRKDVSPVEANNLSELLKFLPPNE